MSVKLQALSVVRNNISPKRLSREESSILSYASQFGSINLSEAQEITPESSRRTVQRKLNKLVSDGYLSIQK